MLGRIHRSVKSIQRSREIANVLVKHGFGHAIERLDLKIPLMKAPPAEAEKIPAPVRARMVLEELGPTFVKFGQIMSMRADLVPEDLILELKKLQDDVPGFSYDEVEDIVNRELGAPVNDLFVSFDKTPMAAASIAQVHRAVLDGKSVVVKVQRPGIEGTIEADLDILFNLAGLIAKHIPESELYDPVGLVEEFAKTIRKELDFAIEGRNADRLSKNFSEDPHVRIPGIYWDYTSRRVLTMDALQGTKVCEMCAGMEPEVRKNLAGIVAKSYLKQIFSDGFFHGDPHSGNILLIDSETIGFLDFGIMGRLDEYLKEKLVSIFIAVMQKNTDKVIEEFLDIGMVSDETSLVDFKSDMSALIEDYYDTGLQQVDVSNMLNRVMSIALKHRIRMPANFALLVKALVTMEAICSELDPEFNFTEVSMPFVESMVAERVQPSNVIKRFVENAFELNKQLTAMPRRINKILSQLESGKLLIDLEHKGLNRFISEIDLASNRVSVSLIISSIIVGSSVIMLTGKGPLLLDMPVLGIIGYMIAGFLGMFLVFSILRSGRF